MMSPPRCLQLLLLFLLLSPSISSANIPASLLKEEPMDEMVRQIKTFYEKSGAKMRALHDESCELLLEIEQREEIITLPPSDAKDGESVIECSKGLYFEPSENRLSYLGDVRLRSDSMHVLCTNLHLFLERKELDKEAQNVEQSVSGGTPPADTEAPEEVETNFTRSPMIIKAEEVVLDLSQETLFAEGAVIELLHERLNLRAQGANPRLILLDNEGFVCLLAEHISGNFLDAEGKKTDFETQGALIFSQQMGALLLQKQARITSSQVDLSSAGSLRVGLLASLKQTKVAPTEVFDRLRRRYDRIGLISAQDKVIFKGKDSNGEPILMTGDWLCYDGQSGAIDLKAEQHAKLSFAGNHVALQRDAHASLSPEGDIRLRGEQISGEYQRTIKSDNPDIPVREIVGEFRSQKEIYYHAQTALIHFPYGLESRDELSELICRGKLDIKLVASPAPVKPVEQSDVFRLPTLPMTNGLDVQSIAAQGGVKAHSEQSPQFSLAGDSLYADLLVGSVELTSLAGQLAHINYQGFDIKAQSEQRVSQVELLPNGDILATADQINTSIPSKDKSGKPQLLSCSEGLELNAERAELILRKNVTMSGSQGIFSSPSALSLLLRRDASKKAPAKYPKHHYNYVGIHRATSPAGAQLQSELASMQSDGPFSLQMCDESLPVADQSLKGIESATASGNVRIAMRSKDGGFYRARGAHLDVDGRSGVKRLSGSRVMMQDALNIHTASGAGAAVIVDKNNNVRITGEQQSTYLSEVDKQTSKKEKTSRQKSKKP